jgi:hypothetical protein
MRVKVARSNPEKGIHEPTHYEVGWRHVEEIIDGRKARCLRARPPSSQDKPKTRLKRFNRYRKVYRTKYPNWEAEGEKNIKRAELRMKKEKAKKDEELKKQQAYKI